MLADVAIIVKEEIELILLELSVYLIEASVVINSFLQ